MAKKNDKKAKNTKATAPVKSASKTAPKKEVTVLSKAQLIDKVAEVSNVEVKTATAVVNNTLEVIMNTVADGDKLQLLGFGNFEPRERSARKGRNPQTGETIDIAATVLPAFSAGKGFKDRVKEGSDWSKVSQVKGAPAPKVEEVEVQETPSPKAEPKADKKAAKSANKKSKKGKKSKK